MIGPAPSAHPEFTTDVALRAFGRTPRDSRRNFVASQLRAFRHPREAPALALALIVVAVSLIVAWMISWIVGLAIISMLVLTAVITRLAVTQHLARAAEITPTQFAHLYPLVARLQQHLEVPRTRVFVTQSPLINAVATGFHEPYVIVLTSALVEALDDDELASVLGHELAHIKLGHTRLGVLLGGFDARGLALPFPLNVVATLRDVMFLWWQRSTELSADRAAIVACGRPSKAISAQVKLSVGPSLYRFVNLTDLAQQAADLHSGVARVEGFLGQLGASHPFLIHRVEAMLDFLSVCDVEGSKQPDEDGQEAEPARLVGCDPNRPWQRTLAFGSLLVGRSPSADLRLHDRAVSRRHFELSWVEDGYLIRDMGSSNGTFVNGQRVSTAQLTDGDVIRAGCTEIVFNGRQGH